jgi:hypothetical protein
LFASVGFAFSITDSFIARTQLQTAADSCALAGAARAGLPSGTASAITVSAHAVAQTIPIGLTRTNLSTDASAPVRVSASSNLATGADSDVFQVICEARYLGYLATWLQNAAGTTLDVDLVATSKAAYTRRDTCYLPLAACKAPRTSINPAVGVSSGVGTTLSNGPQNADTSGWIWVRKPGDANPRSKLGQPKNAGSCGDSGFFAGAASLDSMPGVVLSNQADRNIWTNQVNSEPYEIVPLVTCPTGNGSVSLGASPEMACVQFLPFTSTSSGPGKGKGGGTTEYEFPIRYLGPAATTSQCSMANAERTGQATVGDIKKGGFTPLYPPRLLP